MPYSLPRSTPEAQGVASASILAFLTAVEQTIQEMHSFMLVRHGCVVAEGWWKPYAPEHPHVLFSLSKSFTSTAVGLAVMEGRLSVDDPVISFFPDDVPADISPTLAAMRVRHLLSMATGHHEDTTARLAEREDGNWVKGFLALPVEHEPGTHFAYNSGASYMLSAIVQKLTGLTLLDYLTPRLFQPLGIEQPTWESSSQGINFGGWGLNIRTEDIARFGQLYLQGGLWQGQRLVSEAWVQEATARQVNNGTQPDSDWEQGYGYQFWRCRHGAYRGDGAFGQYCVVMPEQDAVLAITGGLDDMQAVLNLVWEHLLPAMQPSPLPANAAAHEELKQRLAQLAFVPPAGAAASPVAASVSGKTFQIDANPDGFQSIAFDFAETGCTVTLHNTRGEHHFTCGYGAWQAGAAAIYEHSPCLVASGVWTADDTFVITQRYYETPFYYTTTCRFSDSRLEVNQQVNVSFGPLRFSWVGRSG